LRWHAVKTGLLKPEHPENKKSLDVLSCKTMEVAISMEAMYLTPRQLAYKAMCLQRIPYTA